MRPHEKLAALLKKARIDAGIQQQIAADELGITPSALAHIERGLSVKFPVSYFVQMCEMYGVPAYLQFSWLGLFSRGVQ